MQQTLGHGDSGAIFEVRHGISQQNLALKTIVRTGPSSEASQYSASINEVRVMKTLGHPHIVELLGFDIGPDCFSLLMAAVADTDVRRFLGTEVSLERSRGLKLGMCSIAAALGYIPFSLLQCFHMNIKPVNILIRGDNWLLANFGISESDKTPDTDKIQVTPDYAAPETIKSRKKVRACDTWALGCVVREKLTVIVG